MKAQGVPLRGDDELDRRDICCCPGGDRVRALFRYDHDPLRSWFVCRNGGVVYRGEVKGFPARPARCAQVVSCFQPIYKWTLFLGPPGTKRGGPRTKDSDSY
jgi:hypothetical protein